MIITKSQTNFKHGDIVIKATRKQFVATTDEGKLAPTTQATQHADRFYFSDVRDFCKSAVSSIPEGNKILVMGIIAILHLKRFA